MTSTKEQITDYAKSHLKLDAIGYCKPVIPQADLDNYYKYLEEKNYGDMLWMETRKHLRVDPKQLMPEVKTIIVLGANYYNAKTKKDYEISIYANQQMDYHKWLYEKIKNLAMWLEETFGSEQRYFVDSAPVLEKVLAKQTNIGWQGKHTCIVSREFGNWLFLGVLFTTLELEEDSPHKDFCGNCTKCIDACPTNALTPYKLKTTKCLSYLTIEHKGVIEKDLHQSFNNKIFGCDECLRACHFNKWQKESYHLEVKENPNFPKQLVDFLKLTPQDFNNAFKNTPLKRTGYSVILRNCLLALKNIIKQNTEEENKTVLSKLSPLDSNAPIKEEGSLVENKDSSLESSILKTNTTISSNSSLNLDSSVAITSLLSFNDVVGHLLPLVSFPTSEIQELSSNILKIYLEQYHRKQN